MQRPEEFSQDRGVSGEGVEKETITNVGFWWVAWEVGHV